MTNFFQRLSQVLFGIQESPMVSTPSVVPFLETVLQDKLPASALLDAENQVVSEATFYGDLPVPLKPGVGIRFHLKPHCHEIAGIRLRFGTHRRTNQCHVVVRVGEYSHRLPTQNLLDNQYVNIPFLTPHSCIADQPLEIMLYSDDANEHNMVSVWCAQLPPPFIAELKIEPLKLPTKPPIRVSIVIPVFNKVLYTYNCLQTLIACDPDVSKEVIIVNNASTDATNTLLAQLREGFQVINNVDNRGFVEACRQGADVAKGEFILFLNNDTQVTPGWLTHLLAKMDNDSTIGITGSKLVYPDGYLQEAGGIIFNDASGWNYGRREDPTDPRFNQSRPVDYCSGASLMIRKNLWQQVGGFDMRFAPAYYEDTDLCFAIRHLGFQVFYCHDSVVIHHEGITAGTDINSGYKSYQTVNKEKFVEKWREVLTTHFQPPPYSLPDEAAKRLVKKK